MTKKIRIVACTLALLCAWNAGGVAAAEEPVPTGSESPESEVPLSVTRLVVATEVAERQPVGEASEFSVAGTPRLFAFVEVENPSAQPTEVTVSWVDLATGKELRPYTLQIQGHKRWRTWARAAAPRQPGSYAVLLKDAAGNELARTQFTMTE